MAAPMQNCARIRLNFDDHLIANSWLLVDFEKSPYISDVAACVKSRFDISKSSRISLWLKKCLLPSEESSLVLRDDDFLSVRAEDDKESKVQKNSPEFVIKKRKRKICDLDNRTVTDDDDTQSPDRKKSKQKKKKKKSEKISDVEEPESHKGKVRNQELKSDTTEIVSEQVETKEVVTESVDDKEEEEGSESGSDTATDVSTEGKTKRRRRRKHKRKKKAVTEMNSILNGSATENSNVTGKIDEKLLNSYVGKTVQKNDAFYGCLPDKLEPPKYYRHGYRNKKTYQAQPNCHKKFDSDPELEEGSMEQYNFLSKPRKDQTVDTAQTNTTLSVDNDFQNDSAQNIWEENITDQSMTNKVANNSYSNTNEEGEKTQNNSWSSRYSGYSVHKTRDLSNIGQESTHNSDWGSARGSKYETSNGLDTPESAANLVPASPTLLTRKTLSTGASVFCRQRNTQTRSLQQGFREMSKEDQLGTVATNVSTVFVNPGQSEFKVPASPAEKNSRMIVSPSLKHGVTVKSEPDSEPKDPAISATTDFSKLPALVGLPGVGQKIAYKVLEISASCTPEVSDYKVAEVTGVGDNQMVDLKNIHQTATAGPNKFSLELEDDDEILTNTQPPQEMVSFHVSSLLEVRVVPS